MSKKPTAPLATSSALLEALRAGPFPSDAYAWMYEVSNGTGWHGNRRFADAVALSCWPSRGIALYGFEVKVARSDWMREFRNPEKAESIRNWCAFWYVVAPPGIVKLDELPKAWGLYLVDGKKLERAKEAPEQKTKPLDIEFVASLVRNAARQQDAIRNASREAGYEAARKRFDKGGVAEAEKQLAEERSAKYRLELDLKSAQTDLAHLKSNVEAFERSSGLPERTISSRLAYMGHSATGEFFKVARALAERPPEDLEAHFRRVADSLAALRDATKGAA